jgi:uncharacterized protein YyaL (SSP411 family)
MTQQPDHANPSRNKLAGETSPYLLQHATNPVDWRPWGSEALALAKATNRPVLLSIGYAACHWCHVMAHESFENNEIADLMNSLFVNIKVDREERPDIDQIYMAALHALGQQGGWPLTMFLTPDGEPFWGGTYFPPESRWGRPGFPEVMQSISHTYHTAPDRIAASREALSQRLLKPKGETTILSRELLDAAGSRLASIIDPVLGGTHGAPKFPQPSLLDLIWRHADRTGDAIARDLVILSLTRMAEGGIYDHLGGGFARYSVDDRWLVPHFEKMLYDNAQLLDLLGRAYVATGRPLFQQRIEETIGWLMREMLLDEGAFASSLDADSQGEEGRFYVWSKSEIDAILGVDATAFSETYDVTEHGNWEEKVILNRSKGLDRANPTDPAAFGNERQRLLSARSTRIRPGLDDKILADWNGLLITALARLSIRLARPDWRTFATTAYEFIATSMVRGDRFGHSYRQGRLVYPGVASDYAAMIAAALALFEAGGEKRFLEDAIRWAATFEQHHWDADTGAYFAAADDSEALIIRMKASTDEATPSANGLMAENLARLWIQTGDDRYLRTLEALFRSLSADISTNIYASTSLLAAFDTILQPIQAVVVGADIDACAELMQAIAHVADARIIVSLVTPTTPLHAGHPALCKSAIGGRPTLYVCLGQSCSLPVTEAIHVKQSLTARL